MKRSYKARPAVVINRQWFGAEEFRPQLRRSWLSELGRLFGRRPLALVD